MASYSSIPRRRGGVSKSRGPVTYQGGMHTGDVAARNRRAEAGGSLGLIPGGAPQMGGASQMGSISPTPGVPLYMEPGMSPAAAQAMSIANSPGASAAGQVSGEGNRLLAAVRGGTTASQNRSNFTGSVPGGQHPMQSLPFGPGGGAATGLPPELQQLVSAIQAGQNVPAQYAMQQNYLTGGYGQPSPPAGQPGVVPGAPQFNLQQRQQEIAQKYIPEGQQSGQFGQGSVISRNPETGGNRLTGEGGGGRPRRPKSSSLQSGIPTIRDSDGSVATADPSQKSSLDLRRERQRTIRDIGKQRQKDRVAAKRGGGVVPGGSSESLTSAQRKVVDGAFTGATNDEGEVDNQQALRGMFLSSEFQGDPLAAAAAVKNQMTQDDFMSVMHDAYGEFGFGAESPDLVTWLQEVGEELGYDVTSRPTEFFAPRPPSAFSPDGSTITERAPGSSLPYPF